MYHGQRDFACSKRRTQIIVVQEKASAYRRHDEHPEAEELCKQKKTVAHQIVVGSKDNIERFQNNSFGIGKLYAMAYLSFTILSFFK